jgi:ketosteroid isomerase-like protein
MDPDTEAAVTEWMEKLAIREVIERYSSATTRGDWRGFEDLWTEDALWEVGPPVDSSVRGARAILEDLQATLETQEFFLQMTHDPVVVLEGEGRASATTLIHAVARRERGRHAVNYGIYFDEFVKVDGRWRFSLRRQQPVYLDMSPLPGRAVVSRADLAALSQPH